MPPSLAVASIAFSPNLPPELTRREFHDHSGPLDGQAAVFGFAPAAQLEAASERVVAEQFTARLGRLWGPEASQPACVRVLDWSRERFTTTPAPAPSAALGYGDPVLQAPHMDGRLVFASTETAAALAGHLESAIRARRRAAGQALNCLDHPFGGKPSSF